MELSRCEDVIVQILQQARTGLHLNWLEGRLEASVWWCSWYRTGRRSRRKIKRSRFRLSVKNQENHNNNDIP